MVNEMKITEEMRMELTPEAVLAMSEAEAEAVFLRLRWPATGGEPRCTRCGSEAYTCSDRFRCKNCGHQFTATSDTVLANSKLPISKLLHAIALFDEDRPTVLQAADILGVQYKTAWSLARRLGQGQTLKDHINATPDLGLTPTGRKRKAHYLNCSLCSVRFFDKNGDRTSALRRGKTRNVFCCFEHAMQYPAKLRMEQPCKRCGKSRTEISSLQSEETGVTGVTFCNGYCQACYRLLATYQGDEGLCQVHEITQQLRKESTNVVERKKHSRPSEPSSRGNRGGPQGKSGSPAGAGDKRSFISHLAVSPAGL
jgi:transposase-like protein